MKKSLRVLTWATLVCGFAAAAYLVAEPALERWRAEPPSPLSNAPLGASNLALVLADNLKVDPEGGRQLLSAIARLEQRGQVTARFRLEAHLGDLTFHGAPNLDEPNYLHLGHGTKRYVRWYLQSQRDGVQSTMLQNSNVDFLWTDRRLGNHRYIDRVDLWQLRKQARAETGGFGLAVDEQAGSAPFSPLLGGSFGGLPMLLESLSEHFEFTTPRPFRYGDQRVIGLVGRWRPEALAAILTDTSDLSDDKLTVEALRQQLDSYLAEHPLPSRIPHNVLVLLGQQDLFPYLIDYRGASDRLADVSLPDSALYQLSSNPLARLEFYDVRFDQQIDTSDFTYKPPPEPEWIDGTAAYLRRLDRTKRVRIALEREARVAAAARSRADSR
ncbi:MAG: hypothetical protein ACR2NU_12420 [Aeoliella sp.]